MSSPSAPKDIHTKRFVDKNTFVYIISTLYNKLSAFPETNDIVVHEQRHHLPERQPDDIMV